MVAGGAADRRPPRLRLRVSTGGPARHRSRPAAFPGAAGLLRRQHRRPPPAHPGRARHRGGQPQRSADPGRRPPRLRLPGHSRLPGRVLLASSPCWAAGLPALPAPLRTAERPARHAGRGGLQYIARVYATRAWAAFPVWGFVRWTGQMLDDTGYGPSIRRRGRGNMLTHTVMAVLGAALAAGLLLAFYNPGSGSGISLPGSGAVPAPAPAAPLTGGEQAIVTKVKPGLVIINTNLQFDSEAAAGTGMVINPNGLVLTNNHVIDGSTKITATVTATDKTYPATVVGYDKTRDIALIQLQNASGLTIVPIGNSSSVKIGNAVVALGNAEGRGRITAAAGEVTGLNQTITASEEGSSTASETLNGMIQTDADIVPGDSGGPLAGSTGVIGMDTAGNAVSDQQQASAGFAIPINTALSVARQIAGGQASSTITIGYPPFVGIFISSASSSSPQAQAQQEEQQNGGGSGSSPACYTSNAELTVPSVIAPVRSGTLIVGTICGSPAASAGMTGGAVITAVNGRAVGSPDDLTGILSRFHPGDTISVTWVSPAGQRSTSSLHLTAGPPQ